MKRLHLIELEDLEKLPSPIRDGITDFLEYAVVTANLYQPIAPQLDRTLADQQVRSIVDLCAGGGGPWQRLRKHLRWFERQGTQVHLTDLYPNTAALQRLEQLSPTHFKSVSTPVSAMNVPDNLQGFRTLFSAFHHFRPEQAKAILVDAVDKQQGIAIFESTQRHPLLLLYMLLTPLLVLIATPFIRPFRWQRLFWTYLIPAIPLAVMFDGIVSCLRTYTVDELLAMTADLEAKGYQWQAGLERLGPLPVGVTYLIGHPQPPTPNDP